MEFSGMTTIRDPILPAELTWFLAMTEQITTMTPAIVDGCVVLPECAALAALIDWRTVEKLAA
jgi:hypothetical protein